MKFGTIVFAVIFFVCGSNRFTLADSTWTASGSGKWENAGNWSGGLPDSTKSVFIANATSKTVTVDVTTAGSPGTLSIQQLTLDAPAGTINTLKLDNVGATMNAAEVFIGATAGGTGVLNIGAGSTLTLSSFLSPGDQLGATGLVWVTGGTLIVTNHDTFLGWDGIAQMTVSNGTFLTTQLFCPSHAGARGTLTIVGGTVRLSSVLAVGDNAGATGAVWMAGGTLVVTNLQAELGSSGTGQMTVSNGTALLQRLYVGTSPGSTGTLTMHGGTITLTATATNLVIGNSTSTTTNGFLFATGTAWVKGGVLDASAGQIDVGLDGNGSMIVSGGLVRAREVFVNARNVGSITTTSAGGNLTVAGGALTAFARLIVGDCATGGGTGNVTVAGTGSLVVTNGGTGTLDIRSGVFTVAGGLLNCDRLVMTNACARFNRTGGTVLIGTMQLDDLLDADGDGLQNKWERDNGLDPLDATGNNGPTGDLDGDGFSNEQERAAGTVANSSSSALRILAIAREGADVRVTWPVIGGKNYIVQFMPVSSASFTNVFTDFSGTITAAGVGASTTNYLDLGAATNVVSRYYRVRVAQ